MEYNYKRRECFYSILALLAVDFLFFFISFVFLLLVLILMRCRRRI